MRITRDRHPKAKIPKNKQTRVWRYMDFWKFESLLNKKALYLCRADKLQDRFEGTYSSRQIIDMNKWLKTKGYLDVVEEEKRRRQLKRKQFFISSWCMKYCDLDLMWKAYTPQSSGIAIQSTVARLEAIADAAIEHWPLNISEVTYIDHVQGSHIDYADGFDAIIHKDIHFELDCELRLVHWPNFQEPIPEEVFLPVDLHTLIERVVLHPGFNAQPMDALGKLLKDTKLASIPVECSRDDRTFEE